MMLKLKRRHLIQVLVLGLLLLCRGMCVDASAEEGLFKAFVSITPQKYFLEKIAGDSVDISVMVRPGANPATYEPKPKQMTALAESRIYFAVGVPFERVWLKKIAQINPEMLIVHTEKGIERLPMKTARDIRTPSRRDRTASPGRRNQRDQGIKDPHIWLSPALVAVQARNMLQGLIEVEPDRRKIYRENYRAFVKDLAQLDRKIRNLFSGKQGFKFMVYHPAWGYFARAYGLKQIPVEVEGKNPGPRELHKMIELAREEDIEVVFVQPQFSKKKAETIAGAIGGEVILADPLAYDWEKNLLEVARKIERALK